MLKLCNQLVLRVSIMSLKCGIGKAIFSNLPLAQNQCRLSSHAKNFYLPFATYFLHQKQDTFFHLIFLGSGTHSMQNRKNLTIQPLVGISIRASENVYCGMKYSLKAKVTKYNHQRPVLVRFVNSPVKLVIFSLNPKQMATKVFFLHLC